MDLATIDFPDIRWLHGVFYCNSSGSGRDKKYHPWSGVKTDLGEIEEKVWCQIAESLIDRKGESALLKSLIEWESDHNYVHASKEECALPGFVDSKNEEKTERNAGYLVVSHSGGGMLRQGTRKGIRRTPANRGMRAHWVVKGLDISEDVCHGMCP